MLTLAYVIPTIGVPTQTTLVDKSYNNEHSSQIPKIYFSYMGPTNNSSLHIFPLSLFMSAGQKEDRVTYIDSKWVPHGVGAGDQSVNGSITQLILSPTFSLFHL